MIRLIPSLILLLAPLLLTIVASPAARAHDLPLHTLTLPPGFAIEHVADVPGARSLVPVPELGAVLVSTRSDRVYAVTGLFEGRPSQVQVLRTGLKVANGIAWKAGALYIAEQHRLIRLRGGTLADLKTVPAEVLFDDLPDQGWHGWRVAAFGPDGFLYVAVGAPCNICPVSGLEGTIQRFDVSGPRATPKTFAMGVRNSVGLGFHPDTAELWFTDNGADNMGDDVPPDELNHAPKPGLHFGFPYYGGGDARTGAGRRAPEDTVRFPAVRFGAHVAALGFAFYQGTQFPAAMRGDIFVAQHGSWNRSVPDGYRIARVPMEGGRAKGTWETFIEGWLHDPDDAWGRPVDVVNMPDGSLLISDDRADALYRVTYNRP